jgi:AcrR family transcriptional regulator
MDDETDLPDEVVLLWGLRESSRKGPRPGLTVADITRAAITVADADGLAAVSMSRVASELGNSTMALYRHVRSKDELLALMADSALADPPEVPGDAGWRSALTLWAHGMRGVSKQHPWYAQLPISGPPVGPHNLAWFDRGLSALSHTGLDEVEKLGVVMGILTFVHGQIRLDSERAAGYARNPEAFTSRYGTVLARVVDPGRMPALSRVVAAGVFDGESLLEEDDSDRDFGFTLSLYLDGVAGFIDAHRGTPPVSRGSATPTP